MKYYFYSSFYKQSLSKIFKEANFRKYDNISKSIAHELNRRHTLSANLVFHYQESLL